MPWLSIPSNMMDYSPGLKEGLAGFCATDVPPPQPNKSSSAKASTQVQVG